MKYQSESTFVHLQVIYVWPVEWRILGSWKPTELFDPCYARSKCAVNPLKQSWSPSSTRKPISTTSSGDICRTAFLQDHNVGNFPLNCQTADSKTSSHTKQRHKKCASYTEWTACNSLLPMWGLLQQQRKSSCSNQDTCWCGGPPPTTTREVRTLIWIWGTCVFIMN